MDLVRSLAHPTEIIALLRFAFSEDAKRKPKHSHEERGQEWTIQRDDTHAQCYDFLDRTSRSFAAVVRALDVELRDPICIFYLVLRGLDTVEDDMTIPLESKVPALRTFYERLVEQGWMFHENGQQEKDRQLLQNFDIVIDEFLRLKPCYQEVISDICKRMGNGMADFADAKKVGSKKEWDLYCHYVAGLVGIGLSRMFAASGLEDPSIGQVDDLANSMGLFLQKVNIIRDYYEDLVDGRTFWPEEVWSKYADSLPNLRMSGNEEQAIDCLNDLICNALGHIPDCLTFMSMLRDETVFRFCAIPQVMAVATLAECLNNKNVFHKNVKIRKGLAVKLMLSSSNMTQVVGHFSYFANQMLRKVSQTSPSAKGVSLGLSLRLAAVDRWCVDYFNKLE